jgi:hypothetical protein
MIFIALLTARFESASGVKTTTSLKEKERIRTVANGQIRKLFVSNNYYDPGRDSYIETNLYAADDNQLWINRINLVGAGLVTDTDKAPIARDDANRDGRQCEPLVVSRERLVHDCRIVQTDGEHIQWHQISCDRVSDRSYTCKERQVQKGRVPYDWRYRMDLVRIFDESLE